MAEFFIKSLTPPPPVELKNPWMINSKRELQQELINQAERIRRLEWYLEQLVKKVCES